MTTDSHGPLSTRALAALAACGVTPPATGSGPVVTSRSPIDGSELLSVPALDAAGMDAAVARAHAAFLEWRTTPAPVRGRLVKGFGELLSSTRTTSPTWSARGRQDPLRGPRRGAGDDRHLRLRRRPVPPARRPHDAVRAARPPADGDVAPARRRRRDLRVQLPGRGVVVEQRDRAGLRRHRGVEAVGAHAADRPRLLGAARPGSPASRRARRASTCSPSPSAPPAPALVDNPRVAAGQRDRVGADGRRGRPAGGRPLRPGDARARRQQRRDRRAVGRPRPGRARHRLRRRRHRGPALHDPAAA